MPNEDPLPNMTAQERKDWQEISRSSRTANPTRSDVRNLLDDKQRADRERANEGRRVRERTRDRE